MNNPSNRDRLATARDVLLDWLPGAWAVYVYGSFARGDAGPDSDLDLAVLLPPDQALEMPWDIATRVAERVRREVDLVDLRRASDVLRMQVLKHGRILHNARPGEVLAWEAQAITRYAHYRREVAALMDQFRHTGVGYAGRQP